MLYLGAKWGVQQVFKKFTVNDVNYIVKLSEKIIQTINESDNYNAKYKVAMKYKELSQEHNQLKE